MTELTVDHCSASLRNHAVELIRCSIKQWGSEEERRAFAESVVEDILLHGTQVCHSKKEFGRWVSQTADIIAKTFHHNCGFVDECVRERVSVPRMLDYHSRVEATNKKVFSAITSHHSDLIEVGYDDGVNKNDNLIHYAKAAKDMGSKQWVVEMNKWIMEYTINYFRHGGAKKAFVKSHKRRHVTLSGWTSGELPAEVTDSLRLIEEEHAHLPGDLYAAGGRIRVLDVGSCYNPLQRMESSYLCDITAMDLCPADASVYKGDMLRIPVGQELRIIPADSSACTSAINTDRPVSILSELPASYFDVVSMSLVLSYLPSPEHREKMVSKARRVLYCPSDMTSPSCNPHHTGLLLIAEKASIFGNTSSKRSRDSSVNNLQGPLYEDWINCICSMGFELLCYQHTVKAGHNVHLLAFRATAVSEPHPKTEVSSMRIKSECMK